jgi:hypothetical protein
MTNCPRGKPRRRKFPHQCACHRARLNRLGSKLTSRLDKNGILERSNAAQTVTVTIVAPFKIAWTAPARGATGLATDCLEIPAELPLEVFVLMEFAGRMLAVVPLLR